MRSDYLFVVFWFGIGDSFLNFAKQDTNRGCICFAKFFGYRSKTTHRVVLFAAFESPNEEKINIKEGRLGVPAIKQVPQGIFLIPKSF